MAEGFVLFLLSAVAISLSGVMAPGPMFAVTVAKGHSDPLAGAWVGLGHGVVEFPLMAGIYLGFGSVLAHGAVKDVVAVAGGIVLVVMGYGMIRARNTLALDGTALPYNAVTAGVLSSAANPYFLLWWATVGATLVSRSLKFGLVGFVIFAIAHWLCDVGWSLAVSASVNKTKRFWSQRLHRYLFIACGIILFYFGVWFVHSVFV
jgi:threonine/homoserine/homoserine lactone efflux protein